VFKQVLSAYTGVDPSRQTIMMKGQTLKVCAADGVT
jgi:hypothetical protein